LNKEKGSFGRSTSISIVTDVLLQQDLILFVT
jgi:hypothetical protein